MRTDDGPLQPDVAAALEAIDATLEGEPADPEFAELAELSLILRDERPRPDPAFVSRIDARLWIRFGEPESPSGARPAWRRWLVPGSVVGALAAGLVVLVIALGSGGGSRPHVAARATGAGSSAGAAGGSATRSGGGAAASAAASGSSKTASGASAAPAPVPRTGPHRDVTQSARIALTARAGRIDGVAQQVFDVVGSERGIVSSSHVQSSGGGGGADFVLRVPSDHLRATLDRLSHLRDARVDSRADSSADVTAQVGGAAGRLRDDQTLRRSLLADLAAAATSTDADRLHARLRVDQRAIDHDAAALARLRDRVAYSTVSLSVSASPQPTGHHHRRRAAGLTIGSSLHSAGRVLVVAAGVALVALAVLLPIALVVAIAAGVWTAVARRRRESALGP